MQATKQEIRVTSDEPTGIASEIWDGLRWDDFAAARRDYFARVASLAELEGFSRLHQEDVSQ